MKRVSFVTSICVISVLILVGIGAILWAQERKTEPTPMVVLGGLKLKSGADPLGAEKLFKEQLIPAMTDVKGLNMKILKRVKMPNEQANPNVDDYVMMTEIKDQSVLMQLMNDQGRDERLSKFGEMMKEYAGEPHINMYVIIAKTEKEKE